MRPLPHLPPLRDDHRPATPAEHRSGRNHSEADGNLRVRPAAPGDLGRLIEIERACFTTDLLSRRSYRAMMVRASALVLVAELDGAVAGSVVLLFHRTTAIARLYSLAVAPGARSRGLARRLLRAAEDAALERDCAVMRLEVRPDNEAALALYRQEGFSPAGRLEAYYEDGTDALRLERSLWGEAAVPRRRFPYYAQSLDFTCGPAALMMAMGALSADLKLDRSLEIRLWREATTVFMTSGHGGCGPFGLALAAHRRGFDVIVHAPPTGSPMFLDSVRDADKKKVIALVEKDFVDELRRTSVAIRRGRLTAETLARHLRRGDVPIVLISLFRLHGEKGPHWVTVTGYDGHIFRILDPMAPPDGDGPPEISVARAEFERMSRYGRLRQSAAVVLTNPAHPARTPSSRTRTIP